ncbi:MAG: ribosome silencing factor [Oceanipulchritudo sp.]
MTATATLNSVTLPSSLQRCLDVLDEKKAESLRLIHVGDVSSVTDYYLIATGTSNPHLKALSESVLETLKASGEEAVVSGAGDRSGWVVVDAYDFMIHLFTGETRDYFNLEGLWKDGTLIES